MRAVASLVLMGVSLIFGCDAPPPALPRTRSIREPEAERAADAPPSTVLVGGARWTVVDVVASRARPSAPQRLLVTLEVANESNSPARMLLSPECVDDRGRSYPALDPLDPQFVIAARSLFVGDPIPVGHSQRLRWLCEVSAGRSLAALVLPGWTAIDGTTRVDISPRF